MKSKIVHYIIRLLPSTVIVLLLIWFVITFLYTPVLSVFGKTFFSNGNFSSKSIQTLFASKRVLSSLYNSLFMAILTIITVNIIGIFQVAVTEFFQIRFAKLLRAAFFTTLIYGGITLVAGYKFIYGSNGIITKSIIHFFPNFNPTWFSGFAAVLFVHSFAMTTYHIIFVRNAIRNVDNSTIEAARNLGANSFQIFMRIALPMLKPSLYAATLMLFLQALSSNAAPTLLGKIGGKNFEMINSMILTLNSIRKIDMAALLSLILGLGSLILLLLFRSIEKRGYYTSLSTAPASFKKVKIKNKYFNIIIHSLAYILMLIYILPVIFIVLFSFTPSSIITTQTYPSDLSFTNYIRVFTSSTIARPLINSAIIAVVSAVLSIIIAIFSVAIINKGKGIFPVLLEFSLFIPWFVPGSMLGVGLITAFSTSNILLLNNILLGSFWILPIAYIIARLPFAIRMLNAAFHGINENLENAARSLGASLIYTYMRIIIPLLIPTVLSIFALSFNGLIGEYTIAMLLYNVNNWPISVTMSQGAMSTNSETVANNMVFIVILMSVSTLTLFVTNYLNRKQLK